MVAGCLLGGCFLWTGGVSKSRWEVGGAREDYGGIFGHKFQFFSIFQPFLPFSHHFIVDIMSGMYGSLIDPQVLTSIQKVTNECRQNGYHIRDQRPRKPP